MQTTHSMDAELEVPASASLFGPYNTPESVGIWSARDFLRAKLVLCWQRQRGRRSYRTVLEARWRHVAYICNVGQGVGGGGGGRGEERGRTGGGRRMEFDRGREGVRGHAAITEQDALKPVSGTDGCWVRSGVPPFSPLCILHFFITTSSPLPPSH